MINKIRINPALLAALVHYAEGRYNFDEPSFFVYKDDKGYQSPWPLERTCGIAAELLAEEELSVLKLDTLKAGLKKAGMEWVYERIMGEKLEV